MIEVQDRNRVSMSQRERDVLKVMQPVLDGKRTQAEAARLLKRSVRQVRRIQQKLEAGGDAALVHGLRGQPPVAQACGMLIEDPREEDISIGDKLRTFLLGPDSVGPGVLAQDRPAVRLNTVQSGFTKAGLPSKLVLN